MRANFFIGKNGRFGLLFLCFLSPFTLMPVMNHLP